MSKLKFRTSEDAIDAIQKSIAWRKKELMQLKQRVKNDNSQAEVRCNIAMIYAHWEGFVKEASSIYVKHVSDQRKTYKELVDHFAIISLKKTIVNLDESKQADKYLSYYQSIKLNDDKLFQVSSNFSFDTESNLSSKVLDKILSSINIDLSPYTASSNWIDKELVKRRNSIAHGEFIALSKEEFDDVFRKAIFLIDSIQNDIENSIVTQAYLSG